MASPSGALIGRGTADRRRGVLDSQSGLVTLEYPTRTQTVPSRLPHRATVAHPQTGYTSLLVPPLANMAMHTIYLISTLAVCMCVCTYYVQILAGMSRVHMQSSRSCGPLTTTALHHAAKQIIILSTKKVNKRKHRMFDVGYPFSSSSLYVICLRKKMSKKGKWWKKEN